MFTRFAIFEGTIASGREDEFFARIEERMAPLWRGMPQAQAVRVVRVERRDDGAPGIVMIQEVDYPSLQAIDEALVSPERDRARAAMEEVLDLFEGRFYHLVTRRQVAA